MYRIFLSFFIILFAVSSYADDSVVARVNGVALTFKDLDDEVDRLVPRITFHRNVYGEKRKRYYKQALEELINRELEYQEALKLGRKPDKDKVDDEMKQMRNRYKSKEEFKAFLERTGMTEEKLQAQVEKEILIQDVLQKIVTEPSRMNDDELKDYYGKNTSRFRQPESIKARMISTKDGKKAQEILSRIKSGEDFAVLATNMSEDAYRIKGGDIGYIHRGRILPEIEEVAFKLKAGQVSDLIKAENMWYIVKVEDKKPERILSFEETRDKLKKEFEVKRAREIKEKWIADLRAKAKIEILLKTEPTGDSK